MICCSPSVRFLLFPLFAAACVEVAPGGVYGDGGVGSLCDRGICPCTEPGIRAAIAEGGGPFTFDCDGPTTVSTEAELIIDKDVILDGEGKLTVDANQHHRVFRIPALRPAGFDVELRGMHITGGSAAGGGGIQNEGNLTLSNVTVTRNRAFFDGGGIYQSGGATSSLTLHGSTVSENTGQMGGGIFNRTTLILEKSTVRYNTATKSGGGIASLGLAVLIENSTVSRNEASEVGGGVYVEQSAGSSVMIKSSTVAANHAPRGSGLRWNATVRPTINKSLVCDNDCENDWTDEYSASPSLGYNVESPGNTCGFDQHSDLFEVAPRELGLMALQANGGDTDTHALLRGSIAVDRIPDARCELAEDQRGVLRPQGSACDVGAFEMEQP